VPIIDGKDSASPALAVTPDGKVFVAVVVLDKGREKIWLRTASNPASSLGKAKPVTNGFRAWHPRLAADSVGNVWLAWSGRTKQAKRGSHNTDVFLRKVSGRKPGRVMRLSVGQGRSANPELTIGPDGKLHIVWEQSTAAQPGIVQIAYRTVRPGASSDKKVELISQGSFDRRPTVLVQGSQVHVAWDRLVDSRPTGALDPDYDIFLRTFSGSSWSAEIGIDSRDGIQAAVSLAEAPGGGVLVAYHSSHLHGLVKWWTLRRLKDNVVTTIASSDALAEQTPTGEQQGAEFPSLAVLKEGRLAVVTRPSQGAYLQIVDASGIGVPLDLTRRGWGARGMKACLAAAPDGSLLMVRRARHKSVLERFTFETVSSGWPAFKPVSDQKKPLSGMKTLKELVADLHQAIGKVAWRIFMGDLHMHSAASDGTGTQDEILARAWVRGFDFAAITDHDYIVGSRMFPSKYAEMAWVTDAFDARQGFSTLHAFEWTTPLVPKGSGHRNVYFRDQAPGLLFGYKDGYSDTKRLYKALRKQKAIAVPHHTSWTGTDWENADSKVQPQFEIISVHGASEHVGNEPIASRGEMKGMFAVDGLKKGLKFGFLGGSDGHGLAWHHGLGRRLDPWSHGLTAVLAKRNRRKELFDSIAARRTYATSGAAMYAKIQAGQVAMGQDGRVTKPVVIKYEAHGSRPLEKLMLIRDGEVIHEMTPAGQNVLGQWVDETVAPGRHFYYLRVIQGKGKQDTDLAWSSPVFVVVSQ